MHFFGAISIRLITDLALLKEGGLSKEEEKSSTEEGPAA